MSKKTTPAQPGHIACAVCLEEIPATVATSQEGDEYAQHFCGLECYDQWKQQQAKDPEGNDKDR